MVKERFEDVKKEVRSVLISSKEGMVLKEFLKAYHSLVGIRFPSRQLGFITDIDLIESMPDVVQLKTDRNGSHVLTAIADETTEHIQKLVQKQKSNKKKTNSYHRHIAMTKTTVSSNNIQRNRPFVPAKLRSEILQILKKHPDGIGYTAFILEYRNTFSKNINLEWLSSNQLERFKKLTLAVPDFEVKTVGDTEKLFLSKHYKDPINNAPKDLNGIKRASPLQPSLPLSIGDDSEESIVISQSTKNNFKKILKDFPEGIMAVHFPFLYQNLTGQLFDLHGYGFTSLLEMADALPEIFVRMSEPKSSNDWILFHVDNVPDVDFKSSLVGRSNFEVRSQNKISHNLKENAPSDIALPALQYISPELPEEATTKFVPVCISSIISPSHFWFQLLTQDAILGLESLEKEMEYFYNSIPDRCYKMADSDIVVGATCAAFYAVNQQWYRVTITALPSVDSVVVDFVDYGNSDQVPRSVLYYLKYSFIHLPVQAYKAQLAAVKPANEKNKWTRETNKRFVYLCKQIFLMAQVKAVHNSTFTVILCDTSGNDDICINDALVKEGFAEFPRKKDNIPALYVNTSESSSSSSTPLSSPVRRVSRINQQPANGSGESCHRLFSNKPEVQQQPKKYIKRLVSDDCYIIHILLVENKAYFSVGDLSNLFWNDHCPDLLLTRLKYKNVTIPTITIFQDAFPELFEQCERFSVKGLDRTKDSVTLFPLQFAPKIVNILGHPSKSIRNILIKEIDNFNAENAEWKQPLTEPEPYKGNVDSGNKLDRLCLHDLKARQEALRYKRKTLLDALEKNWSDNLIDQIRNLDAVQSYITKRIKEVETICNEFSKCI